MYHRERLRELAELKLFERKSRSVQKATARKNSQMVQSSGANFAVRKQASRETDRYGVTVHNT